MKWKLVLVEPTEEMLASRVKEPTHLYGQDGRDEDYQRKMKAAVLVDRAVLISEWRDLVSASPDPTTDEALVERVARAICDAAWGHGSFDRPTEQGGFSSEAKEQARGQALAVIRAMGEKP